MSGCFADAGLIHDFLYSLDSEHDKNRKFADTVHKNVGVKFGCNKIRAFLVYLGVRAGGGSSYKKCKSVDKITSKTAFNKMYAITHANNMSSF